ncbi:DgyrCDS4516 [Dimorphilus gyrociliatus]|uniref:RNA helicase n=1 Tax=Dimorphilus gyrociliatus TaxID=2664684 RepID=A0A7I8VJG2_9ANNE|nr:DgyrCDS4516 [Dimorphilus gyrociliatus]
MAAHDLEAVPRTKDIELSEHVEFKDMCLTSRVLEGLNDAGFVRPSPVQLRSIPVGRCGLDMIVQAKSGTGKTCVYCVTALENMNLDIKTLQVLVICPTREIAMQGADVMRSIGKKIENLHCHTFIGGLPVQEDRKKLEACRIAIGTPGRIKQLIEEKALITDHIRIFILDEADKLIEDFLDSINWIYSCLPKTKQMIALSATFPESMTKSVKNFMSTPTAIRLNSTDPALLGIRQYYEKLERYPLDQQNFIAKICCLISILEKIAFQQCLIFSNNQSKAEAFAKYLTNKGWPATHISGSLNQDNRISAISQLQKFECRILVTTDLTARGIDAQNVNLVVNLDIPKDHETYLHRIGRAGRFGSYGAAISIVLEGNETSQLLKFSQISQSEINRLPDPIPENLAECSSSINVNKLVSTQILGDETIEMKKILEESEKFTDTVKLLKETNGSEKTVKNSVRSKIKKRARKKMTAADLKNSIEREANVNNNAIDSPSKNKNEREENHDKIEIEQIEMENIHDREESRGDTLTDEKHDKDSTNKEEREVETDDKHRKEQDRESELEQDDDDDDNDDDGGDDDSDDDNNEYSDEQDNAEELAQTLERPFKRPNLCSKIDKSEIETMKEALEKLTVEVPNKRGKLRTKGKRKYHEENYTKNDYYLGSQSDNRHQPTSDYDYYNMPNDCNSQSLRSQSVIADALWDHGLRFSYWMGINYGYHLANYEYLKNQYKIDK